MSSKDLDLQWFAAADEGRTEEPSEHRLRKAREEGRVAKSQDLNGAIVMLFPVVVLIFLAPWFLDNCIQVIRFYFDRCTQTELYDGELASAFFLYFIKMMLPLSLTAAAAGIVANVIQNRGFIFSVKPIEPKFSKIVPRLGQYLKKTIFSLEGAFNVVKSIVKVVALFLIAYNVIRSDLPKLLSMMNNGLWSGIVHVSSMTAKLLVIAAVFFLILAVPDYIVQRRQFMETMKMSKQEVKEEYKELEGDPVAKGRLRQRMREILMQNIRQAVKEADVIITNPTHYAVAVLYDSSKMQGPMVTAKGEDETALRIRQLARENDVPIIENRPLARTLYAEVEIGDIIPETYYKALALILSRVYQMKGKK